MAMGLPVIVARMDTSLDQEIIDNNNCGLAVEPLNPYELAKAIEYLIANPDVRKEMGKNGRKAVLEKYSWEQESRKLLGLYANMLNRKVTGKNNIGKKSQENK
jgi:glycosyltransferase involved in cell wall biosynthesis